MGEQSAYEFMIIAALHYFNGYMVNYLSNR